MPNPWRHVRLSDILEVLHGYPFAGEEMSQTLTGKPLIVSIGNFNYSGGFRFESTRVREFTGSYPKQFVLSPGDLLVAMTCQTPGGEILGLPGIIPDDGSVYLHNQRIGKVIARPEFLSIRFAYYMFLCPEVNRRLVMTASGTKILHTAPSRIGAVEVYLPSLDEQEAIADILWALDDKIAVNDRITGTSVTLADSIHETIAAGLSSGRDTFGTIASVYGGGTPSTAEPSYWGGKIAWTTPTDVTALSAPYLFKTSRLITESGLANCASQLYPAGSIFMTSRATIGAFAVPQMPAAVNQGFIVVVPPRDELRWWLFHEMRSQVDEMLSLANGSTFLELSRKNFKSMQVRVASLDELKRFDAKVAPLHERATQAAQESVALKELRDTLLPKLMSGEIRVRDAEKVVEDVT